MNYCNKIADLNRPRANLCLMPYIIEGDANRNSIYAFGGLNCDKDKKIIERYLVVYDFWLRIEINFDFNLTQNAF